MRVNVAKIFSVALVKKNTHTEIDFSHVYIYIIVNIRRKNFFFLHSNECFRIGNAKSEVSQGNVHSHARTYADAVRVYVPCDHVFGELKKTLELKYNRQSRQARVCCVENGIQHNGN